MTIYLTTNCYTPRCRKAWHRWIKKRPSMTRKECWYSNSKIRARATMRTRLRRRKIWCHGRRRRKWKGGYGFRRETRGRTHSLNGEYLSGCSLRALRSRLIPGVRIHWCRERAARPSSRLIPYLRASHSQIKVNLKTIPQLFPKLKESLREMTQFSPLLARNSVYAKLTLMFYRSHIFIRPAVSSNKNKKKGIESSTAALTITLLGAAWEKSKHFLITSQSRWLSASRKNPKSLFL